MRLAKRNKAIPSLGNLTLEGRIQSNYGSNRVHLHSFIFAIEKIVGESFPIAAMNLNETHPTCSTHCCKKTGLGNTFVLTSTFQNQQAFY